MSASAGRAKSRFLALILTLKKSGAERLRKRARLRVAGSLHLTLPCRSVHCAAVKVRVSTSVSGNPPSWKSTISTPVVVTALMKSPGELVVSSSPIAIHKSRFGPLGRSFKRTLRKLKPALSFASQTPSPLLSGEFATHVPLEQVS